MAIPFKQYLRPDGRTRDESIERPAEVETLARQLLEQGVVFECEHLQGDMVALYARDRHDEDAEFAMELVDNGPEVPVAVDRLVRDAATAKGIRHHAVAAAIRVRRG